MTESVTLETESDGVQTSAQEPKLWAQSPWVPYDERVVLYDTEHWEFGAVAQAWEYTGWRDETLSWKTTASLNGHLNPTPTSRIAGPQALEFLQSVCVNSFAKFTVGASRHAIMTDEKGRVTAHGMLLRVAEDEFLAYWLAPYLAFRVAEAKAAGIDFTFEDLTGQVFLFQLGGPRSLEILEDATEENLHDIKFLRHRFATIAGEEVRILRIGMSGTIAYEIHGSLAAAQKVYQAIYDAGLPYGVKKIGVQSYMCNHTEAGFGQAFFHMPLAWHDDENPPLNQFMSALGFDMTTAVRFTGSAGGDLNRLYRSPYDLGWGHMVKFDHEFPGRAALEAEAAENRTTMVTLVWNEEDLTDLFRRTHFGPLNNITPMRYPNDHMYEAGLKAQVLRGDKVLADKEDVGTSSGRTFTLWSGEMLSLATIDTRFAQVGQDVVILWGDEGTEQVEIRAKVARFPYLVEPVRNEKFDVSTIPSKYPAH